MNTIFQRSNPAIEKLFSEAGNPAKVMCVPIDYAKKNHTALVCNGLGQRLRAPFEIHNDKEGIEFVLGIVNGLCRKHHIKRQHVFFGGEDCSSFSFNFIHDLAQRGFLTIGVNCADAKTERQNKVASTDAIDLLGIASVLVNKKWGRTIGIEHDQARILRNLTHHRRSLVKARTASAYRIHNLVDQLFPGFLDPKQSGVDPFSRASLWLMSERFSPKQIKTRRSDTLLDQLRAFSVQNAEETVRQLRSMADRILPPPPALCETLQDCMSNEVTAYQALEACIHRHDLDIAKRLALTPGAMLTTITGIAVVSAAALYAELGDPARKRAIHRLASFAGIVDRLKQTGGSDHQARSLGRTRKGNRVVKDLLVELAVRIGQYGHPELKADYSRREIAGQDVRFTMARRMLRICCHVMQNKVFFVPPSLLKHPTQESLKAYYQQAWRPVLIKWRNSGAILQAFGNGAPLEEWRQMANELYGLNLTKKSPQASDLHQE
jgi:transposase